MTSEPQSPTSSTPHDALFRMAIERPEDARGMLEAFLPEAIRETIDWTTLELQPGSFVSPELSAVHSDALFHVKLAGRTAMLYLVVEHQSAPDPWMAFRMLVYVTEVLRRYRKEHPEATKLPIVVPMVLHHGESGWTAPTSLEGLWDADPTTLEALGKHVLAMEFALDDLVKVTEAELESRAASAVMTMAWLLLKRMRTSSDPVGELMRWAPHMKKVLAAPNGDAALMAMMRYTLVVTETAPKDLRKVVAKLGPKAEEALMTGAEILRKEGEARGEARGRADLLLRQLRLRFGGVTPTQEARIRSATTEELDRWADLVLTAKTLDEFGL